jgi:hypothetical protein
VAVLAGQLSVDEKQSDDNTFGGLCAAVSGDCGD